MKLSWCVGTNPASRLKIADPVAKYIILHVDESRKHISNLNIDPLQFQEACSMPAYAYDLRCYVHNVTNQQLQMC